MDSLALLRSLAGQASVRSFSDRPVAPELVEQIVEVARWTGSARNRQPWRFVAVFDRPTLEELGRRGAYAQHLASAPCALVLLSADNGFQDTEFDLGKVTQTVILAATALGLGSCLATLYPDPNVAAAARLLNLDSGWLPRHAISLGYPGATVSGARALPSGRLPTQSLLTTSLPLGTSREL